MLRVHKRNAHSETKDAISKVDKDPIDDNDMDGKEKNENDKKKPNKYIRKRIKCNQCDKQFNKESRYQAHKQTVHVGKSIDVGATTDNSIMKNTTITNNIQEMTSQYHLRRPRVQVKQ